MSGLPAGGPPLSIQVIGQYATFRSNLAASRTAWAAPCAVSRDAMGSNGDGLNAYGYYASTATTDPTGLLTIEPDYGQKLGNVGCGNEAFASWNFLIDTKLDPERKKSKVGAREIGYLVQEVVVTCNTRQCENDLDDELDFLTECAKQNPPQSIFLFVFPYFEGVKESFTYYEAWPIEEVGQRSPKQKMDGQYVDRAGFSAISDCRGIYHQKGTVKFFSQKATGVLEDNNLWHNPKKSNEFTWYPYKGSPCATSPRKLLSFDGKGGAPGFWNTATALDGPAERSFELY